MKFMKKEKKARNSGEKNEGKEKGNWEDDDVQQDGDGQDWI